MRDHLFRALAGLHVREENKEKLDCPGNSERAANYPNETFADLYDDTVMPPDHRRDHQDNDRAVWEAYDRAWPIGDEAACGAHLMRLYQE